MKKALMVIMLLLSMVAATETQAQSDRFDANFTITQKTFGKKSQPKHSRVRYQVCNTYKMALTFSEQLMSAIRRDNEPGSSGMELDQTLEKLRLKLRYSRANGTFTAHVEDGMGVLVLGDDGAEAIAVQTGTTEYSKLIEGTAALDIDQVDVTAKKMQPKFRKVPSVDTGYEMRFNINAHLEKGYVTDNSRLMVMPVITDCQTDDTVAYLTPLVYEGRRYHRLQDNRMDFNYHRNDPVAFAYHPEKMLRTWHEFSLDTNLVFRKPDKDRSYKCSYFVTVEDYNHLSYDNGGQGTGSCLSFKPFKFLNFNVAATDMLLTSEFYDQAESRIRDVPRDLQLRFVVGTDELTQDSINEVVLRDLTKEMASYGDRLTQIRIEGAASPEGSLALNQRLASQRAVKAQRLLRARLGGKADYVRLPAPTITVYTWADVARAIETRRDSSKQWQAREIRAIIDRVGEANAFGEIRNLLYYDADIVPVLESQRVMKCSYQYEVDHVMNSDEVIAEYMGHKQDYIAGRRDLSDGDYFNLFNSLTDSLELDTLTDVAYRHITRQPAYELLRLSPYVANRKALKNMRQGIYDTGVLRPFVDFSLQLIGSVDRSTGVVRNRKEILANQAICYFQEAKLDTAQYMMDWIIRSGGDSRIEKLSSMITFTRGFFQENRTPEEEAEFQKAYEYVLSSSPENRAVIFSELHQQLPKTRDEAEEWVLKMRDDDARKWYLEGILWSEASLGDDEGVMGVPRHLAFFQHSFDLMPRYKRYYFNEGNVSDEVRKMHPYRRKDIERYRNAFSVLKADIDRKAEADAAGTTQPDSQPADQDGQDGGAEEPRAAGETAPQPSNQAKTL